MLLKKTIPAHCLAGFLPVILVSLLTQCGSSQAAEAAPATQYAIEQPSQSLADALQAIAHETGTSVLFDPGAVRGRVAHSVSGRLTALEAIKAAIQGTGLVAEQMKDGAVVVRPAAAPAVPSSGVPLSAAAAEVVPGTQVAAESAHDDSSGVTKVEITGTRLKRINAEGPAPVNVYTRKDIEQSGQPNLERFLSSLNEVSASSGEGGFSAAQRQATVQLRGLPLGTTLVLINGRRVEAVGSSPANFFNLNLIPMAAIERVEVVPVGSSAVYGGDALAGVVNVILKKSIDGFSLAANAGSGRGFGDGGVSLAAGDHGVDGSYLLLASYSHTTPLTEADRGFFLNADYRRYGGTDERVPNCTPGTVSSVSGANLPGLNSSFAAIPKLASGQTPQISDFVATAGTTNLCDRYANGNGIVLVNPDDTLALHATGEHKIVGSWSAFGEFTFARERTQSKDTGLSLPDVTVPANNPFNPFGEDVEVTALLGPSNGLHGLERNTKFTRALAGVHGGLGGDWEAEFTLSTARDNGGARNSNLNVDPTLRAAALGSSSPATALNPFTTGRAASEEVLRSIWSDDVNTSHGRKDQVSGLVRGSVFQLPAGAVETVLGAESARDHFDFSIPDLGEEIHDGRRNSAVYGELRAPLLSMGSTGRTWSLATLTLAARRDRYSDFGSANTYQGGLEIRPSRSLLIRASSATSFKPPTLLQTNVSPFTDSAEDYALIDPSRGGETITSATVDRQTNKALGPERGRASSLGAVWEPESHLGTRLGANYWKVHINGLISLLDPQTALNYESQFPSFVTRGPSVGGQPGPVTGIKFSEVNFGSVQVAGTDMDASYAWRGFAGRWTASVGATRTSEYQVVLSPGAAKENRLGLRFDDFWAPRWKDRASIALDTGTWSVGLTSRYLGQYKDEDTSERRLGAYWMHDLFASIDLKKSLPAVTSAVKAALLSLGVANLTNRQPQFAETFPYYDVTQADWRGRYFTSRVSLDW